MKTLKHFFIVTVLLFANYINAQVSENELAILQLPQVEISKGVNILFISPEPIEFVDLSTNSLVGDLPSENIARVKIKNDNDTSKTELHLANSQKSLGVITIVGQSFMAQYRTVYRDINKCSPITNVQIQPDDMQPLEFPKIGLSHTELRQFSMKIFSKKDSEDDPLRTNRDFKMKLQLNNVYVYDDYIFLDISLLNKSNLSYDIENIKFSIDDKKIYKATNNQSITLKPIYQLFYKKKFRKKYRNIFVFRKFTYPNSKVLKIRFIENPISGRTIDLKIKYSDVLNADVF